MASTPEQPERRRLIRQAWAAAVALGGAGCGGGGASANGDERPAPAPPPPAPPTLPSWVPEPGRLSLLSAANDWASIDPCPDNRCGYRLGSGPEWNKVIDDYSGGIVNPHWGPLGALMFHGGGHAATNDNSVALLDFNDLRFKRVADPSLDASGLRPQDGPLYPGYDREFGEYVADRKPGSAHTYDALAVLPPELAGAPFGALVRPFATAIHVNLSAGTTWAHLLALHRRDVETAEARARNAWSRWSVDAGQGFNGAGGCCAFDPVRQRIWWTGVPSQQPGRIAYLDCVSRRQLSVAYTGRNAVFHVSLPIMRHLAGPDLLLSIGPVPDRDRVQAHVLRPDAPQGGWQPVVFDHAPPVGLGATPWAYVPELRRIVLFTRADPEAMYEIAVPADPAATWPVVRRPFQAGARLEGAANVVGKRFDWAPALRCVVYKPLAQSPSGAQFYAYRPWGT